MSLPKSRTKGSAEQARERSLISTKNEKSSKNGKTKKKNAPANGTTVHADEDIDLAPVSNGSKKNSSSKKANRNATDQELFGSLDNKELLKVLMEVKNGNFGVRMPIDQIGLTGKICDTLNEIISLNEKMMMEFTRAGNTIGKQGKLTQRIEVPNAKGVMEYWCGFSQCTDLRSCASYHRNRTCNQFCGERKSFAGNAAGNRGSYPARVNSARIAKEVNDMVKQLNLFSMEVTRVAREVGSEGKLGGQAKVKGVAGVWKDLTDSVNQMGSNLTAQVRNIAEVTTAVAKGDFRRKLRWT